jgi:hypothetical protein
MKEFKLPTIPKPLEVTKHVIVNKELTKVFYIYDKLEEAQHLLDNEFTDKENFRILTLKFPLISYQHAPLKGNPTIIANDSELELINYFSFLHKLFIYEVSFIGHSNRGYIYSVPTKEKPIYSFPTFIAESEYAFFICLEIAKLKMKEVITSSLNFG